MVNIFIAVIAAFVSGFVFEAHIISGFQDTQEIVDCLGLPAMFSKNSENVSEKKSRSMALFYPYIMVSFDSHDRVEEFYYAIEPFSTGFKVADPPRFTELFILKK